VRFPLSVDVGDLKVLIIDDITDTGETLQVAVEYVEGRDPAEVRTGVLQHKFTSAFTPDYYAEYMDEWCWVIYPWAVHEDLVGFVERVLSKGPGSFRDIDRRLRERFEIRAPEEALARALDDLSAIGRVERKDQDYHAVREA
ncbi:MAG: phosphoribosyltransferase family protein, partial [Methanomicrobiaceae archaeon]|nr:phosphoribosyltransferase family protein [Methanomicrobiaceae archaeon]